MIKKTQTQINHVSPNANNNWYRYEGSQYFYTKGVHRILEKADAAWLLEEIFRSQEEPQLEYEVFQVWQLRVKAEGILLVARGGGNRYLFSKKVKYAEFPLSEMTLQFYNNGLSLPTRR